ncbi:MAG: DNA polymerase domain-containing protein [archaeon]
MRSLLIDAYRHENKVILWLKSPDEDNIRIEKQFTPKIYLDASNLADSVLGKLGLKYKREIKYNYLGKKKEVYSVAIYNIGSYERIVSAIEKEARYRLPMYNADIPPEQMFLFQNQLKPFDFVEIQDDKIIPLKDEVGIPLITMDLKLVPYSDIRIKPNYPIKHMQVNAQVISGTESYILKKFVALFELKNPDLILMEDAFCTLPYLIGRLQVHKLACRFNRWDDKPIRYKGGKSFFSYGRVLYRDYAVRLNGRFLLDSSTVVGSECNIESIIELAKLSGTRLQQIASRSFGAVFQSALVGELINKNYLVPFKEKPVDQPISMHQLLKFDRVGFTFDPIVGLHKNVAEIDFSSLFPWIIYNYNISPETMHGGEPPYQEIPGIPLRISLNKKGIIPTAIKPLLDRRMYYKKNPTQLNKIKSQGLKWVLVTSYGYLRFREFKLGLATSHMAIGAFAREIIMKAKAICEEHGFKIIHGIVDSLYIQKDNIKKDEVKEICSELELELGIPVSDEGIFKWIVFLPSVNDDSRPVPTRYYGVYLNNEIKVRGMEIRQSCSPKVVRAFQQKIIELISSCDNKEDIQKMFSYLCQTLRKYIFLLPTLSPSDLAVSIRISKTDYKKDIPQKIAAGLLEKKGIKLLPGQKIYFIYAKKGIVLPQDYDGRPDTDNYKRLMARALFVIVQPFGFKREDIIGLIDVDRQAMLCEYENYRKEIAQELIVNNQVTIL